MGAKGGEQLDQRATLAILAGGRGQRLGGVPKGLLIFQGRPLIERLLDLRQIFAEVLLVADDPSAYQGYSLRSVSDRVPGRGAPGGVQAALAAARTPWVFAVGCDMPFVDRRVVQAMLDARTQQLDLICFEIDGRLEPLLAVYRSSLAEPWEQRLPGQPSFRELFLGFRAGVLAEARLQEIDPELRSIVSINSPEDLGRWRVGLPTDRSASP